MTKTEEAIEKLKKIGYTDDKIRDLLEILQPEVEEQLFLDLASICTDEEIEAFTARIKEAKTAKDYDGIIAEMAEKAYGPDAKGKIDEILASMLDGMGDLTLKVRKTYQDYMAGDPNTKKSVDDLQNSPEVQQMVQDMEDDGFDFKAAASS